MCLLSGFANSASDVAAFFQVGLDTMRRRPMFSHQSKAMLVAKEVSHTVFLWVISLLVLILKYPSEYASLVILWISFAIMLLPTLHFYFGRKPEGVKDRIIVSWAMFTVAVIFEVQIILALISFPYTLGPISVVNLGLLTHWIIDFLTHNWEKSEAREGLDIPKEEADVSMFYPLAFWGNLGIPYDYRPKSNDLLWKLVPKGILELAVLMAAMVITAIKFKLL